MFEVGYLHIEKKRQVTGVAEVCKLYYKCFLTWTNKGKTSTVLFPYSPLRSIMYYLRINVHCCAEAAFLKLA